MGRRNVRDRGAFGYHGVKMVGAQSVAEALGDPRSISCGVVLQRGAIEFRQQALPVRQPQWHADSRTQEQREFAIGGPLPKRVGDLQLLGSELVPICAGPQTLDRSMVAFVEQDKGDVDVGIVRDAL